MLYKVLIDEDSMNLDNNSAVMTPCILVSWGGDDGDESETRSETPVGSLRKCDDSFLRHSRYYFEDGNVTFLVNGFLYCVHLSLFSCKSVYFSKRSAQLGLEVRDHEALPTIVSLGDVECEDFETFLSVLYYPESFEAHDISYEQWRSVLHLSTRWGFASLRELALKSIKPQTPCDRLLLARTYAVDHWIVPSLTALCKRRAPLSPDEVHRMKEEDVALVATIREDIRTQTGVKAAEISRRIQAIQAGVVPLSDGWSVAGAGAARAQPKANDLTQFGKINKATPMTFTPTGASVSNREKGDPKSRDSPMPRTASSSSISSMLQSTSTSNIPHTLASALATARNIEDINRIPYPEGIKGPKAELNVNTQKGKFRYDRDFLLQFTNICKERPENLPPLDVIGIEPSDTSHALSRDGSFRNRASNNVFIPGNLRSRSIGLHSPPVPMGQSVNKMSSEERFIAASCGRSTSVSGVPLGDHPPVMHTINQGGTNRRDRTRSKRGANGSNRADVVGNAGTTSTTLISNVDPPTEPVAPLSESPEAVECKIKALLNKLTTECIDSISDQIVAWANKSEEETDGRTLLQVVKLVFEKATDEPANSEMCARLCRKIIEQISPKVRDDGVKNSQGKPFAGANLFRKYLLNRCQEDFERGWVAKEVAVATESSADQAVMEANKKTKGGEEFQVEMYLDEHYAAAKAKHRRLGLIRFIGELFKVQMLTERIMHNNIKQLIEKEEIESLCELLNTVGSLLDTPKSRSHIDVYFSRMRDLTKNKNVNARVVLILQDVIELRELKWISRNTVAAPTTIARVHGPASEIW